jgi:hypothetical protein
MVTSAHRMGITYGCCRLRPDLLAKLAITRARPPPPHRVNEICMIHICFEILLFWEERVAEPSKAKII